MSTQQMDLFDPIQYEDLLHGEILSLKAQLDHHRKSFFARQNEMSKAILRQQQEIDRLREMLLKSFNKD